MLIIVMRTGSSRGLTSLIINNDIEKVDQSVVIMENKKSLLRSLNFFSSFFYSA